MRRLPTLLLCLFYLVSYGCSRQPALVGRWETSPPASLSYEIRRDRSIWLTQHGQAYRVFGYKLLDQDTLQLFDGMGRMRQYDFQLSDDQLLLFNPANPGELADRWVRQ